MFTCGGTEKQITAALSPQQGLPALEEEATVYSNLCFLHACSHACGQHFAAVYVLKWLCGESIRCSKDQLSFTGCSDEKGDPHCVCVCALIALLVALQSGL